MFEFFFKYPATVYRKGEFVFASAWPLWLLALLVLAAGVVLRWHVRRNLDRLEPRQGWVSWGLQTATAALALFLLWQPAISIQSLRPQQNVVSVLFDTSRSMALRDGGATRLEQAVNAFQQTVIPRLEERFRVRYYNFDGGVNRLDSLEEIPPPGNATRVGEAVAGILRESTALPLGAVVVVSDGADNSARFNRRLMAEIRQRNVPVHTLGVGRVELPNDTELSDVSAPVTALPNSRVNAQATIRHSNTFERKTRLTVHDDSKLLAAKEITLRPGERVQTEFIDFSAGEAGLRNLRFSLEPLSGEEVAGNNVQTRVLDVPRGRKKILYVEGEPRWEYKFIRRAVFKDPSVQLVTLLRTSTNKYYRQGVDEPEELADGFPAEAETLFAYDALIIGSFEAAFFTPKQQAMMRDFVSRRGGSLLMLGGRRGLGDGGWAASDLAAVLPVALPADSERTFSREKVSAVLTVHGQDSLICRLDEDPAKNLELWKEMPQLADYQRVGEPKPGAVRLLDVEMGRESLPLLVTQNYGRGRALVFASGGSWRWKMQLPHDDNRHHTFWQQLLRSLVANTPGPVTLSSDRTLYADDPRVQIRAEARTKTYEVANNATVTAVVTPSSGDAMTIELHPSPEEEGVYEAEFTAVQTGPYRIEASAQVAEEPLGSDVLHITRQDGIAEDFHPQQNRELLATLAEQTGGRYWTLDNVAGLPEEVRYSEAGIRARELLDLWDLPLFFLLLIALRAAEWLLRRRWGVV